MKKWFTFLMLLLVSSSFIFAQSKIAVKENSQQKIVIDIETLDIEVDDIKTEKGYFSRIFVQGSYNSNEVGSPSLPIYREMLEVPIDAQFEITTNVIEEEIIYAEQLGIENLIYPAQPSYSKSYTGKITLQMNEELYATDNFYQFKELAEIEHNGIYRNINLATLTVSPIQYNPATKELKIVRKVEVTINYIHPNWSKTGHIKNLHASPIFTGSTVNILNTPSVLAPIDAQSAPIRYTIISNPMFEGAFDELIAWKKRKGFIVDEKYTNDPEVGSTTTSIKNYLQGLYDNATASNPAPTFVLFVGDLAQFPSFSGTTENHITDLYYVTFTDDHFPDAFTGRMSATTMAQLTPQIEKTLMYEQYTMRDPSYLDKAVLVAGSDSYWSPTHANGQINYLSNNYVNTSAGYTDVNVHLHPCSNQATTIRNEIGAGVGFATYTAHCSSSGWADPSFTVSHVSSMQNDQEYGLMIGNCCLSGKFDESVCFGEALLRTPNKGAVVYLGASNTSIWDEDYYWSIGYRSNTTASPSYNPNLLGAYDSWFHTHNEDSEDWVLTGSGISYAGNMSVQNSPSNLDLYYWEIYHLFGDPSIMPYQSEPDVMQVQASAALPVGMNSLSVSAPALAYVALTKGNEIVAASYTDASGNATLTFNPATVGVYELAVWAQNYVQYFQEITVIPTEGSYVTPRSATITDNLPSVNNATLELDVDFTNFGNETANNCYAKLSSSTPEVTIEVDSIWLGTVAPNAEVTGTERFSFKVNYYVQNGATASFTITTYSEGETTQFPFSTSINAPVLEFESSQVFEYNGNDNSIIDPGETARVLVTTKNTGSNVISDLTARLHSYYSGANVNTSSVSIESIASNDDEYAVFEVQISEEAAVGSLIPLYYQIYKGDYMVEQIIYLTVGSATEDFESDGFEQNNWEFNNYPWITTASTAPNGDDFMARSPNNLGGSKVSYMQITCQIATPGNITFNRKVSSEEGYDFFKFYIDGTKKHEASGEEGWSTVSFPVEAGERTFKFLYEKDSSVDHGSDCAFVDNIVFPPMGSIIEEDIAMLEVTNHDFSINNEPVEIFNPGTPITANFSIANHSVVAATDITATLTSNNSLVSADPSSQTIASISETGTVTFTINSDQLAAAIGSENYQNLAHFELLLTYGNGEVVYPFTIDFGGKFVGVSDYEMAQSQISIFPNPAINEITISSDKMIQMVSIYDVTGKEIKKLNSNLEFVEKINISDLESGIYFVRIMNNEEQVITKKIIKQ